MVESTNSDLPPDSDPVRLRAWADWIFYQSSEECWLDAGWMKRRLIKEAERIEMMGIDDCPEAKIEDAANKARTFNPHPEQAINKKDVSFNTDERIMALETRVADLEDMLEHAITAAMQKIEGPNFNAAFETPPDAAYSQLECDTNESVPVPICPKHPDAHVTENGCTTPGCTWAP